MSTILLTIANKALRKINVQEIISLTQAGNAAARCNAAVVGCVKEVLGEHAWGFATEWATFSQLTTHPPFGYEYAYQKPLNCVKLLDIRATEDLKAPKINFTEVRGHKVYTDATPCYARYVVYEESDLRFAPPLFIDACACCLGREIAGPLANYEMIAVMEKKYGLALDRARLADAGSSNERQQDDNRVNSILAARGYPGTVGDMEEDY